MSIPAVHSGDRFRADIDLFDETLREGAERAPISATIDTKCALAERVVAAGIRTLVVGMFPDVPHNIELLAALLDRQRAGAIPAGVRFVVISHLGATKQTTMDELRAMDRDLASLWVLGIHSVSDQQIEHLYPTVREKGGNTFDRAEWEALDIGERRAANLRWYGEQVSALEPVRGLGGFIAGLLDAFRADPAHVVDAVSVAHGAGLRDVRLVDTAGTCTPIQADGFVRQLVDGFPDVRFYGHFHDDFGMATANAVTGLRAGLAGADVSIGGFANRAGHPAMAEVVMALRQIHGVLVPGFDTSALFGLSRLAEQTYALLEGPAQAVTGTITHAVQSGIRTELVNRAPRIFDDLDPADVGSTPIRMFGVRSGRDGLLRVLREHADKLTGTGIVIDEQTADRLYDKLAREWEDRSALARAELLDTIARYHSALFRAIFTEEAVIDWVKTSADLAGSTR